MSDSPFVLLDRHRGATHALRLGENILGRSRQCDIALDSASIARRHSRLVVSVDRVEVIDLKSTGGTYVNRSQVRRANLSLGDCLQVGGHRLRLLPAGELRPELPAALMVKPTIGAQTDRAWETRGQGLGEEDGLWAALYLRWRTGWLDDSAWTDADDDANPSRDLLNHEAAWPVHAIRTMCSGRMLRHLCQAYFREDRFQWFVFAERVFLDALATSQHGIGPLLLCNIAANHPCAGRRGLAGDVLTQAAATDVTAYILRRLPKGTDDADLLASIFKLEHEMQNWWTAAQFEGFMSVPGLVEAAERVVFTVGDSRGATITTFRLLHGALITLDDTIELEPRHQVRVARSEDVDAAVRARWSEHLADFEVVQPFPQFGE